MKILAQVWGRDDSGEIVCPVIFLWGNFSAALSADNVTGALAHGSPVYVRAQAHDRYDNLWLFVLGVVIYQGQRYVQSGWVRDSLIRYGVQRG